MPKITASRAIGALLVLVFLVGGGNLWATWDLNQATKADDRQLVASQARQQKREQAAQRAAGLLVEEKLCTDLGTMAKIPPPAGPAETNPSRAYEQAESRAWHGLVTGLDCKQIP